MRLENLVIDAAARTPTAVAVRDAHEALTYAALDERANRCARLLARRGIGPGDRVGLWADKSAWGVAVMQGVLRTGAAYVPLDPMSPASRVLAILRDCPMKAVFTNAARAAELVASGVPSEDVWVLDEAETHNGLRALQAESAEPLPAGSADPHALAYILYTSGSTGVPKGVCISHRNALAFVDWAVETLQAQPEDRFSNHAPFFFDLSVLDLYGAFSVGASVSLIPEVMAFSPRRLVEFVRDQQISIWYSVPSALILMMAQGRLLEEQALPVRAVLFAGEPFPVQHLRALRRHLPGSRLLNLYGPTETNVCTFHEVEADLPDDRTEPVPIGRDCSGDRSWIDPEQPQDGAAPDPSFGELVVEGPTVMLGYWGREPQGGRPYRTGDLVRRLPDGSYQYIARRDNMMKVRGRRIEPGEIEAALVTHPLVAEAAVVAVGSDVGARLVAFVVPRPGGRPTLLELKRVCADRVPRYMIIDELRVVDALPRTANGKTDRRALQQRATQPNH